MSTSAADFESVTESGPLIGELRQRIALEGAITFRDFMDAALYHPRYGYYRTEAGATSRGGDFVTSPEVHPVFGALVGRQLAEMWVTMGRPPRFDVIEQGGGRGLLARDIVTWAQRSDPAFDAALTYALVEPAEMLRPVQARTLEDAGVGDRVVWHDELPSHIEGCLLSNELVDAFPVHRVVRQGGELQEIYVDHDGTAFRDAPGPLSTPELSAYFDSAGVQPGEGCLAEVNLQAPRWIAAAAAALQRGYVFTFDYGYEAAQLYARWRRDGTLLCFYRQSVSSDPYQRIGKQDITASVDFTALRVAGERAGLRTLGHTDQSSFLLRLGINEGVAATAGGRAQIEEYFARRNVVLDLLDPAKLGRVRVLLQGKGVPDAPLQGFGDG